MRIKKQTIHTNPWFSLEKHNFENGGVYYFIHKRAGIFIIAENDEGKIAFIEETRYPVRKNILQLPAGMVGEENELTAAKRELLEETGIRAKSWEMVGQFFVAPGHENTKIIVFYAKDLTIVTVKEPEKDIKSISWYSKNEINEMVSNGKIECGITLAALHLYFIKANILDS